MSNYELRCRECGRSWGNQPRSICDDCFSPLEVAYDYDALKASVSRERISQRPPNMWRYSELLPLPQGFTPRLPVGFTPLFAAPRLAERLSGTAAGKNLYIKNDAVCLPTLSFKDRVVAVALSQARAFGFDTVSCSSTGNLANAVAAHAAREGLKAWIFIPSDLDRRKDGKQRDRTAEAEHHRALARHRQSRGWSLCDQNHQGQRRMERRYQ